MKAAVISAVIAAVISAGAASAGTAWINGAAIRPGTIRISRLAPGAIIKLRGDTGPAGPMGPAGPAGPQGPAAPVQQLVLDEQGCIRLAPTVKAPFALAKYQPSICPETSALCVNSETAVVQLADSDGTCPTPAAGKELIVPFVEGLVAR